MATGLEKVSFHSNAKEGQCQIMFNDLTVLLVSHASEVILKLLQARLQEYVNKELSDVHVGIRKRIGTRNHIANICWIIEKGRELFFKIYFCFTDS